MTVQSNERPLADAGLDRDVTANATVYLDATGSRDPDGEIESYEWSIERPDGSHTNPSCGSCGRTSFVPHEAGTYNATVTVTDDDGATSTDTLRVTVDSSDGPSLTVSGPSTVTAGAVAGFSATLSAGSADLTALTWRLDGRRLNRTTVSGDSAVVDHGHAFVDTGNYTLTAVVVDRMGRERTRNKSVTVVEPSPPGSSGESDGEAGSSSDSSDDCYYPEDSVFSCEADSVTSNNGTTVTISDTDRDGNVTVNGTTFTVRTGDTITINQSTWQDHYQINTGFESYLNRGKSPIYYQSGIEQGSGSLNKMIGDWSIPPTQDIDTTREVSNDDETGPWVGANDPPDTNTGRDSGVSDEVPEAVKENINRLKQSVK